MITPYLEKLLLENKAVYKTHNHGVSGVGTIPNPNSRTIIITDIIYHPFIDSYENKYPAGTIERFFKESGFIHTLRLKSGGKDIHYTFKDEYNTLIDADNTYIKPGAPLKIDTYFNSNEEIQIDVFRNIPYNQWNMFSYACPAISNEDVAPLGYGTDMSLNQTAVQVLDYTNAHTIFTTNYVPLNVRNPDAFGPQTEAQFLMHQGIGGTDENNNPSYDINSFPVITFGYVELLGRYNGSKFSA